MWLLVEVNECKNIFSKNQVMMFFGGVGGHWAITLQFHLVPWIM
jgi:hypothetical protein